MYRSQTYSSLVEYEVGESVDLLVDPDHPQSPLIDDALHRFAGVMILSCLAAGMFFAFGVTMMLAVAQPR